MRPSIRRASRRLLAALVLGALLPVLGAGCFGRFELTRKVYRFNREVDQDKWIQWLTFLVMNVIPIYPFATFLDVFFANSVEFWTGKNPIAARAGETRSAIGPQGERVLATRRADGAVELRLTEPDGTEHTLTLVRRPDGFDAQDTSGQLLAALREVDGVPRITAAAP